MHVSLHSACKSWLVLASAWGGKFGLVFGALLLASPEKKTNPIFVDVTQEAGLGAFKNIQGGLAKRHIIETMGGGAALFDYDRDGNLDIVLVRGSTVEQFQKGGSALCSLFRGDGRGRFNDVTAAAGIQTRGWGMGVVIGDVDNDGWEDFFLAGYGSNALLRNQGDGTFRDITVASGLQSSRWSVSASFADFDRDGDLDLYVAN